MKLGWLSPEKKRKLTIVGSQGAVIFDDTLREKVHFYKYLERKISEPSYPSYSSEEPLLAELREFISCLTKKRQPKTNFVHGAWVVKVIQKMEESIIKDGIIIEFS